MTSEKAIEVLNQNIDYAQGTGWKEQEDACLTAVDALETLEELRSLLKGFYYIDDEEDLKEEFQKATVEDLQTLWVGANTFVKKLKDIIK